MSLYDIMPCKICSKPFPSYGSLICRGCLEQIDKDFLTIREYLYDNPGKDGIEEISESTGVSEKIILFLLETGRLSTKSSSELFKCSSCGKPLAPGKGKICESCAAALAKELSGVLPRSEPVKKADPGKKPVRMHIDPGKFK